MRYVPGAAARFVAFAALILTTGVATAPAFGAIIFGQVDDFEDGTTMGWVEGEPSPNQPINVADGGPGGAGDAYVRNTSGGFGAGSRLAMFNDDDGKDHWLGNYNAAGVSRISGWFANFGATPLRVRVAFEGAFTRFSSTRAFDLPADGVWRRASFDLAAASMTRVSGTATLATALSGVSDLRVLTAAGPSYTGDFITGTLAVDDLRALRPEGDANFDGRVDAADFRIVRSNLGSSAADTWREGDFNFDGRVNARDVALLRANYRSTPAAPASGGAVSVVPEPSAAALLFLAATHVLARRHQGYSV